MAAALRAGWDFCSILQDVGLELPKNCFEVGLAAPVDGTVHLVFRCHALPEDLTKFAHALHILEQRAKED